MALCLFGDNPLSETMIVGCQLYHKAHISMIFFCNSKAFIQENAWGHVCEMLSLKALKGISPDFLLPDTYNYLYTKSVWIIILKM